LGEIPTGGGQPTGATAETCSFSIELITIVATFVLYLFLPVVVIAFQLWWMLLLKFCWPRPADLDALFTALPGTALGNLGTDERQVLSGLLGVSDVDDPSAPGASDLPTNVVTKLIQSPELSGPGDTRERLVEELAESLVVESQPEPTSPAPASLPPDPLC
jgi:hypothetical protein